MSAVVLIVLAVAAAWALTGHVLNGIAVARRVKAWQSHDTQSINRNHTLIAFILAVGFIGVLVK